jgi:hypothetical protein
MDSEVFIRANKQNGMKRGGGHCIDISSVLEVYTKEMCKKKLILVDAIPL